MKLSLLYCSAAVVASLALSACSDDDNDPVNPADANAISDVIAVKFGAQTAVKVGGPLPTPSTDASAPVIRNLAPAAATVNGGTVNLSFDVDTNGALAALFAKVAGADDLFRVDFSTAQKVEQTLTLSIEVPSNVRSGQFCVNLAGQDDANRVSAPAQVCVTIESSVDASPSPTAQPTPTPSPSSSPSPTSSPTTAPTPTGSTTPSPSPSPTGAATPTPSASPSPTPTPGSGGSAAACYNATLLATGTQTELTYKTTSDGGTTDFTDQRTVGDDTTFDGRSARETTGTTTSTSTTQQGSATTTSQTATYTQVDNTTPATSTIGVVTTTTVQGVETTSTVTVDPGVSRRFNLNPGESFSQNYTTTTESSGVVQGIPFTTTTSSQTSETVTYIGRESVSVPAGSFEVCRFQVQSSRTAQNPQTGENETTSDTSDIQIGVGNGVLIRQSSSGGSTTELQGGSINGQGL